MYINRIVLGGRLTRDPELTYTDSGVAVAKLTIANNKFYYEKKNLKTKPMFVNVVVYGKMAENVVSNCERGDYVVVDGELDINYYKSGNLTRKTISIDKVSNITWTQKKREEGVTKITGGNA